MKMKTKMKMKCSCIIRITPGKEDCIEMRKEDCNEMKCMPK